jgi:hypothetical protein
MNPQFKKAAITGLQWVLGLVVLLESARFALSSAAAHQFARTGLPQWIPPALGGSETLASFLFLVPSTRVIGGYALLVVFAIALTVHILHGQFDVGGLVVYSMAVIVCMTHRNIADAEAPHD